MCPLINNFKKKKITNGFDNYFQDIKTETSKNS